MYLSDNTLFVRSSSINERMQCSHGHALKYRDGLESAPSFSMDRGTAPHAGLEYYWNSRIADATIPHDDPALITEATDTAVAKLKSLVEEHKGLGYDYKPEELELWLAAYEAGLPKYFREHCEGITPHATEGAISATIGEIEGVTVVLTGIPDLTYDGEEKLTIADYKTGLKTGHSAQNKFQALDYLTIKHLNNDPYRRFEIHKLIARPVTKTRKAITADWELKPVYIEFDAKRAEWVRSIALAQSRAFLRGERSPNGPVSTFGCSGCSMRFHCEFWDNRGL